MSIGQPPNTDVLVITRTVDDDGNLLPLPAEHERLAPDQRPESNRISRQPELACADLGSEW